MFKPAYLLLTGLLVAGNLFGQTERNKPPAAADASKSKVRDASKPSAEKIPPARLATTIHWSDDMGAAIVRDPKDPDMRCR